MTRYYIRKVYGRMAWRVINARGEQHSIHMTYEAALAEVNRLTQ